MKRFGVLCGSAVLFGVALHYADLRYQVRTITFKHDISQAEARILRDEIQELRSKRTYEQGVIDTALRISTSNGFEDGVIQVISAFKDEPYVNGYHNATSDHASMVSFLNKRKIKELELERQISYENGYKQGRTEGYHSAVKDVSTDVSHPDYKAPTEIGEKIMDVD